MTLMVPPPKPCGCTFGHLCLEHEKQAQAQARLIAIIKERVSVTIAR